MPITPDSGTHRCSTSDWVITSLHFTRQSKQFVYLFTGSFTFIFKESEIRVVFFYKIVQINKKFVYVIFVLASPQQIEHMRSIRKIVCPPGKMDCTFSNNLEPFWMFIFVKIFTCTVLCYKPLAPLRYVYGLRVTKNAARFTSHHHTLKGL